MKIRLILSAAVLGTLILGSCGTSNEVVGGGILQKRKYNKGFYWNRNDNTGVSAKNEKSEVKEADDQAIRTSDVKVKEVVENETFTAAKTFSTSDNSATVTANITSTQLTGKNNKSVVSKVEKPLGIGKNTEVDNNEVAKNFKQAMAEKAQVKTAVTPSNGNTGNIILIILLIIAIVVLLSLLPGWIGYIISLVLTILIIYFLLKLLGII
jgi:cobalamin biosynthesis Mg chelatase CobN